MTYPSVGDSSEQEAPGGVSADPMSAAIADIITFNDVKDPDLWTRPTTPPSVIAIVDHDPAWADDFAEAAHQIRLALSPSGAFVGIDHVGSTSVPGLPAKPIIDIALVVDDPTAEDDYVPALAEAGFVLTIREPAWYEHRMLKRLDPEPGQLDCNLHVFGPRCAEVARMRLFRDWLREHEDERGTYETAKRTAAEESNAVGETVMGYNARKQAVVRGIYHHIFEARDWV
ncbi:GrpB family protein [Brevibacterium sp. H602]|uniref:GrpB family protein n=1 Tax=unclassified Brevibacterium TaxID=2614124 RepID=UPI0039798ECF